MKKEIVSDRRVLSPAQAADLLALEGNVPDTVDIPEAPAANWRTMRRPNKVRKEPISLRLDADVLAWLRNRHDRYQIEINRILREKMDSEIPPQRRSAGASPAG